MANGNRAAPRLSTILMVAIKLPYTTNPPSAVSTCPVMKEAPPPARNAAAAATSSGVPKRPIGDCSSSMAIVSVPSASTMSVRITPGATQFTRMPDGASSTARERVSLQRPDTVAAYYMERLRHRRTECVVLASVDARSRLLCDSMMSDGSATMSLISPREIFLEALRCQAVSIILVHNHPSGDPSPSKADMELTGQLAGMGQMLGIPLLDHVIIGDNRYMSFREEKLIP